jgi:nucleotide-binding universal stress UspA family protein
VSINLRQRSSTAIDYRCTKSTVGVSGAPDAGGSALAEAEGDRKEVAMFETIVWATDGSAGADRALPYARELVKREGANLVVVHVKEVMVGRAGGYPVFADDEELEARIRAQVDELRDEGLDVTLEIPTAVGSQPAHAIAEVAQEVGADAILIGTRGHGPLAGLLLGSVAHRLLHIAPCPVIAVTDRDRVPQVKRRREKAAVH